MKFITTPFVVFRAFEQRQHVVPAPAVIAHLAPAVVILGLSPDIKQAVQGGGPAQHFAARPFNDPPVEPRIGLGFVAPVDLRIVDRFEVSNRDMYPRIPVATACFKQNHLVLGIRAQAICDHTACRSCADNNKIRFHCEDSPIWIKKSLYR